VGKRSGVGREEFIRIWNECGSIAEVSERTGIRPGSCSSRASSYRRRGERMKQHRETPKRSGVGREEFIRIWNSAKTSVDAASAMGLGTHAAFARAGFYRSQGEEVKYFHDRGPVDDAARAEQKAMRAAWVSRKREAERLRAARAAAREKQKARAAVKRRAREEAETAKRAERLAYLEGLHRQVLAEERRAGKRRG